MVAAAEVQVSSAIVKNLGMKMKQRPGHAWVRSPIECKRNFQTVPGVYCPLVASEGRIPADCLNGKPVT